MLPRAADPGAAATKIVKCKFVEPQLQFQNNAELPMLFTLKIRTLKRSTPVVPYKFH
jgi:hypothetical protein